MSLEITFDNNLLKEQLPKDYPVNENLTGITEKYREYIIANTDNITTFLRYVGRKLSFKGNGNIEVEGSDLGLGNKGENFVRGILEIKGYVFISNNNNGSHDLKMLSPKGKEVLFEVKTEISNLRLKNNTWEDTGNVAIEHKCGKKLSGISTTKSDYFISFSPLTGDVFFAETKPLQKYVIENKLFSVCGGDNNSAQMYLIKRKKYKSLDFVHHTKLYDSTIVLTS